MRLILLEALGAMLILVGIVWWTMFSGRNKGEPPSTTEAPVIGGTASGIQNGTKQPENRPSTLF